MIHTYTHAHKLKFKGQSVQKIEWKQTDERTGATDCCNFQANAAGKMADNNEACDHFCFIQQ